MKKFTMSVFKFVFKIIFKLLKYVCKVIRSILRHPIAFLLLLACIYFIIFFDTSKKGYGVWNKQTKSIFKAIYKNTKAVSDFIQNKYYQYTYTSKLSSVDDDTQDILVMTNHCIENDCEEGCDGVKNGYVNNNLMVKCVYRR